MLAECREKVNGCSADPHWLLFFCFQAPIKEETVRPSDGLTFIIGSCNHATFTSNESVGSVLLCV